MKKTLAILTLFLILSSLTSRASTELGLGSSSITSGRVIPAISLAYSQTDWSITGSSLGVKNSYYYQSAYTLSYFSNWKAGTIFSGDVIAGFGGGALVIQRGFRESTSATLEESSDFALGPALRVTYFPISSIFIGVEAIYGIRDFAANVTLNFQDVVLLSFGVSL